MKYYRNNYRVLRSMYIIYPTDIISIDKLSCYASQWFDDYGNAKGSHDSLDLACLKRIVLRDKSNFFVHIYTHIKMFHLIDPADITCPL